jgi:hypothetical protein
MVKLLTSLALSSLIISSTFASSIWDIETRELDEVEDAVFAREMLELFARQDEPEYMDLARRKFNFGNFAKGALSLLFRRELGDGADPNAGSPQPQSDGAGVPHSHRHRHHDGMQNPGHSHPNGAHAHQKHQSQEQSLGQRDLDVLELEARQDDPEYMDLARRKFNFGNFAKGALSLLFRREVGDAADANAGSPQPQSDGAAGVPHPHRNRHGHHDGMTNGQTHGHSHGPHAHQPPAKHELHDQQQSLGQRDFDDELLERGLDYELMGEGLFERFDDDLDLD